VVVTLKSAEKSVLITQAEIVLEDVVQQGRSEVRSHKIRLRISTLQGDHYFKEPFCESH
jgi:hypothetical protein